jgi:hypothetical protein
MAKQSIPPRAAFAAYIAVCKAYLAKTKFSPHEKTRVRRSLAIALKNHFPKRKKSLASIEEALKSK